MGPQGKGQLQIKGEPSCDFSDYDTMRKNLKCLFEVPSTFYASYVIWTAPYWLTSGPVSGSLIASHNFYKQDLFSCTC